MYGPITNHTCFGGTPRNATILFGQTVTAPIPRVPEEGTLGPERHLEAHLDKVLEGLGGVEVTILMGFRLLSHPLSHLGV
jgi:hypothetical protein